MGRKYDVDEAAMGSLAVVQSKMQTPRNKLRGIKRKRNLNLLEASFGESHSKRLT
jgi:hypothetical protein